jgi:phage portal protein BeeE
MSLFDRMLEAVGLQRQSALSIDDWAQMFGFGGSGLVPQTTLGSREEHIGGGFTSMIHGAYQANGVVFACMLARMLLFSEARFQFQRLRNGRPGELFSTPALRMLEEPWPGGTTGDLLKGAITDADLAGNAFILREPDRYRRLRPDWMVIVAGSRDPDASSWDLGTEVLGYLYQPNGPGGGQEPIVLDRRVVAHYKPIPDPLSPYRGMSWLTPVVREIMGDSAATTHKLKFFEQGATPNLAVKFDPTMAMDQVRQWAELFRKGQEGYNNAYRTMFLGGGAQEVIPLGANLRQIDFKQVQGAGETRIAAAAGVPPVIVGLSEGLQAATYSNYGQARRRYADLTMRPLWRDMAGALSAIIDVPGGARLWYDDRDIPFLQEDVKDEADIQSTQASTIRTLSDAGFTPESVIDAVTASDFTRLVHTGTFSVQLQPPGKVASLPEMMEAGNDQRAIATLLAPYLSGGNGHAY